MTGKSEKRVRKFWANAHSVSNKSPTYFFSEFFVQLVTTKILQQTRQYFCKTGKK